jgi:tryptophan-rich sensory protein
MGTVNLKEESKQNKKSSALTALLFVGGCQIIGFVGSFLGGAFKKQAWSDDTAKPGIWPPQRVFPLVWIGNYTLMGLASWQVWRERKARPVNRAFILFAIHLLDNFLFIPTVNAVKKRSFYTLMDALALILAVITARSFAKVSKPAFWLMLPYLGWLCFTTFIKFLWWQMEGKERKN